MRHSTCLFAFQAFLALSMATPAVAQTGTGWQPFSPSGETHEAGLHRTTAHSGRISMAAGSLPTADSASWLGILQVVEAKEYRGSRVRFSAFLSTTEAQGAGLFIAVYYVGNGSTSILALDSTKVLQRGTTGWQQSSLVLDVPPTATCLTFGARLIGTGLMLFDDVAVTKVSPTTPTTARSGLPSSLGSGSYNPCEGALPRPTNLGFED